jgi:hypothetical protein
MICWHPSAIRERFEAVESTKDCKVVLREASKATVSWVGLWEASK